MLFRELLAHALAGRSRGILPPGVIDLPSRDCKGAPMGLRAAKPDEDAASGGTGVLACRLLHGSAGDLVAGTSSSTESPVALRATKPNENAASGGTGVLA